MIEKIVLTGAGGRLGSYIREPISKLCNNLISTDIKENIGSLYKNEQYVYADLSNFEQINRIIEGATMVCHFGAIVDDMVSGDDCAAWRNTKACTDSTCSICILNNDSYHCW